MNANDIKQLIVQNKQALLSEIQKSQELVGLLGKSTYKKLSSDEKKKVRLLLIDVCRTLPAFTIFMLPGGMVLLPLFAKLIPEILPNSFRSKE